MTNEEAGRTMTPQEQLADARSRLAMALHGALAAIQAENATPGLIQSSFQALAQAEQLWNNAIIRIPISLVMPEPDGPSNSQAEAPRLVPCELLGNNNARKWADTFLAHNVNNAINREELVEWFAEAINAGRMRGRS